MSRVTIRRAGALPAGTGSDEEMAKSDRERLAEFRKEMRKRGFLQHSIYVHKDDWARVKKYLERVNARRREPGN
jgi:hypothetical protein